MVFRKKKINPEKSLNDGPEEFDKVIIDLTRERISQEFDNVAADELKGSIIIGAAAAIIGITLTVSNYTKFLFSTSSQQFPTFLLSWIPLGLIALSFLCGIVLVYSREKIRLIKPRETNNDYSEFSPNDLRKQLKKELIENFEFIENGRKCSWFFVNAGFMFLIAGVTGIFITLILISK